MCALCLGFVVLSTLRFRPQHAASSFESQPNSGLGCTRSQLLSQLASWEAGGAL